MEFAHAASLAQLAHPGGANPSSLTNFLGSLNSPHPKALSTTIRGGAKFPDALSTDWGYAGAYWGYGFHEDGVNGALAACAWFGKKL